MGNSKLGELGISMVVSQRAGRGEQKPKIENETSDNLKKNAAQSEPKKFMGNSSVVEILDWCGELLRVTI